MRVLVTGISGFAGSHLAELLIEKGHDVFGTIRQRSRLDNITNIRAKLTLLECDLRDRSAVDQVISISRPDYVFHLAAESFPPSSFTAPVETITNNVVCQLNLLETVRTKSLRPRILIAGSAEEYGRVFPEELPITESNELRPESPYAVSKVAQDLLGFQYFSSYGMYIIRTRAFDHTGPRHREIFPVSDLARKTAEIEAGQRKPLLVVKEPVKGRDLLDVRDVTAAYFLALEMGIPGEVYNIATGRAHSLADILEILLRLASCRIESRVVESKLDEAPPFIGDAEKFTRISGWYPRTPVDQTVRDLLNYWRLSLRRDAV